jgi:hypothetical protein
MLKPHGPQGGSFSAVALLPEPGRAAAELASSLDMHALAASQAWRRQQGEDLLIVLPKFKVESQVRLADVACVAGQGGELASSTCSETPGVSRSSCCL